MAEPPPAFAEEIGSRYLLERELGRGGMATVWLARDLKHERLVALKVLRADLSAILGGERFLREIQLTAALQHPHILPLLDSGEAAEVLYYVMPYVEGESLRERLERDKQLPIEEALRLTSEVAEALDYAHQQGVIHRDIKPENILLSRGHAMVADFGIALAVTQAGGGRLTETGLSLGTPAYMSPEQAMAEADLDARTDQYSLACVLYEMLAGEPPYTGPTAQAIIAKRLNEPVPHLGTLRQVPSGVQAAVTRALARAPADRFPSIVAFSSALSPVAGAGVAGPSRRGRHPRVAAAGVLALALVTAGIVALTRTGRRSSEPTTIAVLPVRDLSGGDSSAFAAGLTEDLGTAAAAVPGLLVVSSRSAAVAEHESDDPRAIGQRLGVSALLETTVRTSGNDLRVVARLVRARDGAVLWSNRYDRARRDVIAIQEELAQAVAGALRLRLTPTPARGVEPERLVDPRVYDLYARAVQLRQRHGSLEDMTRAAALLDSAITIDPGFGRAHGELAFALREEIDFGAPYRDRWPAVARAVDRGLAADPDDPLTLAVAVDVAASRHLPDSARRLMERALARAPGDAYVRAARAGLLTNHLRLAEGLLETRLALQLAPLDASAIGPAAWNLVRLGQHKEAIVAVERAIGLNPQDPFFYMVRGTARACAGQWREAFEDLHRGERTGFFGLALLGVAHALRGDTVEAADILRRLTDLASRDQALPVSVAWIHAIQGRADSAFAWLERAEAAGNPYTGIADFFFDGLAADPRWLPWARRDVGDSVATAASRVLLEHPRCRP